MNKRMKQVISSLLALSMCVTVSPMNMVGRPVYAATIQEKIDQARRDKQSAQASQKAAQGKMASTMEQVTKLDDEAEVIRAELSAIDDIISRAESEIAQKEAEILAYEQEIEKKDEDFRARLRAMDESSATEYIDILLNAESLSDFVARVETIREITEHDQGIINEMVTLKQGVEESKNKIVIHKKEQEEARSLVQAKEDALNAKIAEKQNYIKSLEKDIKKYDQLIQAAQAQEEALKRSIASSSSKGNASGGRIAYSGGVFCWPAPSYTYISSEFGYRIHPVYGTRKYHSGMDMAAPGGSPILAAADGVVKFAGWNGGYGNCIIIDHGNGIQTLYGHSSKLLVSSGQSVSRGQKIALVGTTGTSTGNHLHFEVLNNGAATDPRPYLQ